MGRYFSINSVKAFNEKGFLNNSFKPISLISFSMGWSDEAVKITMFLDRISPSCLSDSTTSHPLNPGMDESNKIRSNFEFSLTLPGHCWSHDSLNLSRCHNTKLLRPSCLGCRLLQEASNQLQLMWLSICPFSSACSTGLPTGLKKDKSSYTRRVQ